MPSIAGMFSSIGPTLVATGFAPSATARSKACLASTTRNAMAQAHGPCSSAKRRAKLSGSALTTKLTSPWRYSVTSFERCCATAANPMVSNSRQSFSGSVEAYSTNSKPSVPIGLSSLIVAGGASCG